MTKLILSPATSGKTYNVKVSARNDVGVNSAISTPSNIVISAYSTPPAVPTSVSASSDPVAITIKWTNPADRDLKAVEVYYATSSGGSFSLIGSIDGAPGVAQEYNLNYDSSFSLNQTYYFKLRSINTSNVASSTYTSEVTASFSTISTSDITLQAVSNMFSAVTSNNQSLSTVADSITYSSNGGASTSTLQGIVVAEITLGAVSSDISGFAISATAMVQKKNTWSPNKYVTGVVLQKVSGNAYYEQATGFGSSAIFLGDNESDSQDYADGVQSTYATNSIDSSGDVIGTTGSKYALFLYTNNEPSYNLGVFAGTGLTITELKR